MASIQINRGTTTEIENTPYRDGLISFDTDKKEILMDNGGERETYGANGTEVVANPQGQPTGDLQTLGIGEDIYNISGGHTIQNTSGTAVTQRTKMRINGAYVHDDSTNQVTDIDIVRDMTKAELETLSGDEIEGFQHTTDEPDELQIDIPIPNELNDLDDVNIDETTLSGNQILTYNNVTKKWENNDNIDGTIVKVGNPITFNTVDGGDFSKAEVEFSPIQDLHGYDNPWVGGAGKNKLPLDVATIKSVNTSGTWSDNTYTINDVVFTLNTDNGGNITGISINGTATANTTLILIDSFTLLEGSYYLNGADGGAANQKFIRVGKASDNSFVASTVGSEVTFSLSSDTALNTRIIISNGTETDLTFYPMIRLSTVSDSTFEPYSNICPITGYTELNIFQSNGSTTTPDDTYTQSLGGTYYGGTLDFATGKLTIEDVSADLGSFIWVKHPSITAFYTTQINGFKEVLTQGTNYYGNGICSSYKLVLNRTYANGTIVLYRDGSLPNPPTERAFIVDSDKYATMDATQFKTAMSGVQLVYELATPTVINLTPTQISALVGDNAMWTDGDTLSVKISVYVDAQDVMYDENTSVKAKIDSLFKTKTVSITTDSDGKASIADSGVDVDHILNIYVDGYTGDRMIHLCTNNSVPYVILTYNNFTKVATATVDIVIVYY